MLNAKWNYMLTEQDLKAMGLKKEFMMKFRVIGNMSYEEIADYIENIFNVVASEDFMEELNGYWVYKYEGGIGKTEELDDLLSSFFSHNEIRNRNEKIQIIRGGHKNVA